jgi:hypothetical protein
MWCFAASGSENECLSNFQQQIDETHKREESYLLSLDESDEYYTNNNIFSLMFIFVYFLEHDI